MQVMRNVRSMSPTRRRWVVGGALAAALTLGAAFAGHAAFERAEKSPERQAELAQQATITADQARDAALAAVPGTVQRIHLDREWGGQIVYEVRLQPQTDRRMIEVEVDARTGAVVDTDQVDDDDD